MPPGLSETEELELLQLQKAKALGRTAPPPKSVGEKVAPFYLGPAGPARLVSEGFHALDKAAYGGGEKVTDFATEKGASPEVAAGLGTAANIGIGTIPTVFGAGIGKLAQPSFQQGARKLMESAISASPTNVIRGKVGPAVETMLEHGYNATNAGVTAMKRKAGELKDIVTGITDKSNKMASTIPAQNNLAALEAKLGKGMVEDADVVRKETARLLSHPNVSSTWIPVKEAQAMKELLQAKTGNAGYGLGLKPAAERDSIKATARGLREAIEHAEPGVVAPNRTAAELRNAISVVEPKTAVAGNPLPFGASVAATMNNPAAALGLYANSSAYVKSMLARLLNSGSGVIPTGVGAAAGSKVGSISQSEQERRDALARQLGE